MKESIPGARCKHCFNSSCIY